MPKRLDPVEKEERRLEAARSIKPGWVTQDIKAWSPKKDCPQKRHLVAAAVERGLKAASANNMNLPLLVAWLSGHPPPDEPLPATEHATSPVPHAENEDSHVEPASSRMLSDSGGSSHSDYIPIVNQAVRQQSSASNGSSSNTTAASTSTATAAATSGTASSTNTTTCSSSARKEAENDSLRERLGIAQAKLMHQMAQANTKAAEEQSTAAILAASASRDASLEALMKGLESATDDLKAYENSDRLETGSFLHNAKKRRISSLEKDIAFAFDLKK